MAVRRAEAPCARQGRVAAIGSVVVVAAALLVGGCSSNQTALCRAAERGRAGFDTDGDPARWLASLRATERELPVRDRGDVHAVVTLVAMVQDAAHYSDAQQRVIEAAFARARDHLDRRLDGECGIHLGPLPKVAAFGLPGASTTTAGGSR